MKYFLMMLILYAHSFELAKTPNTQPPMIPYNPWIATKPTSELMSLFLRCTYDVDAYSSLKKSAGENLVYFINSSMIVMLDSPTASISFLTPYYSGSTNWNTGNSRKENRYIRNLGYSYQLTFHGSKKPDDIYQLDFWYSPRGFISQPPHRALSKRHKVNPGPKAEPIINASLLWPEDSNSVHYNKIVLDAIANHTPSLSFFENFKFPLKEELPSTGLCTSKCGSYYGPMTAAGIKRETKKVSKTLPNCLKFAQDSHDERLLKAIKRVEDLIKDKSK